MTHNWKALPVREGVVYKPALLAGISQNFQSSERLDIGRQNIGNKMMMKKVARFWVMILISPAAGSVLGERRRKDSVSSCLLKNHFYDEHSGSCQVPLDPGSCPPGQWLLPSEQPGELFCCPDEPMAELCTPVLLPGQRKVVCEENILAERYNQGQCGPGELVLPENFQADSLPCPHSFSCTDTRNNSLYHRALKTLQEVGGSSSGHEKKYLKDLVCDYQTHSLCLPDQETDSLFTMETMLASLKSPLDRCRANPCPPGRRPWLEEDGYYRCLTATPDTANCPPGSLTHRDGQLHCDLLGLKSVAPARQARCPRRQIWSRYREKCIIIYG